MTCKMMIHPNEETIKGSRNFENYPVMRFHKQQESYFKLFQGQPSAISVPASVSAIDAMRQSAPLSSLREFGLREMKLDYTHRGCVLYGKFCVRGYHEAVMQTVLEDTTGKAIAMTISYNSNKVVEMCRFGQKVAAKEPYLLTDTDGRISLRVENPLNIEVVPCFPSEVTKPKSGEDVASGPGTTSNGGDGWWHLQAPPDFLQTEGNRQFAEGNFEGAIGYYDSAILACNYFLALNQRARKQRKKALKKLEKTEPENSKGAEADHDGEGASPPEDASGWPWTETQLSKQYLLAFSNRADAWLRLGKYHEALWDSIQALKKDPLHEQTLLRKEEALRGLQS